MKIAVVLLNYKDYAERFLAPCLASIKDLHPVIKLDLVIVDNASTASSADYLSKCAPEARLILNDNNDGFAKGNNDAMRLLLVEGYDYILLLNMDASLAPDALTELVRVAEANPLAAAVQARLMLDPDRHLVNSLGNAIHFLGFGYCQGYRQPFVDNGSMIKEVAYFSGACVLLRAKALREVGLFDEEFWMYNEDQDLGWRFWLAGWKCLLATHALAYHQYEFSRSVQKYYWMERNRLIAAWKNYSLFSLIILFPAFLAMEIGMSFFAWRCGWLPEKRTAWFYFFQPRHWLYLLEARRSARRSRQFTVFKILSLFF